MALSEAASFATKQVLLPNMTRGFKYARWKSQKPINALKQKGLTVSKIQKELKSIHNVSSAAYRNNEIVCSSCLFQLVASFCLGLSVSSFIIFITSLIICGSLEHIRTTLDASDMVSQLIIEAITIKNVMIICAICSIVTVLFGFIGIYIMHKSYQNCFNQYIEAILSVHEHIHDRLCTKYEKHGIKWKLFVHYKDRKRINIFGAKHDITYYGILIQVINHIDRSHNSSDKDDNNKYYNVYNVGDTSTEDEYATTSSDDKDDKLSDIQYDATLSQSKMSNARLFLFNNDDLVPFIGTHIKLTN